MSAAIKAVVGEFYMVPCMQIAAPHRLAHWPEWMPVIGPKHNDADLLRFRYDHVHIDWRFVPEAMLQAACARDGVPHATVVTSTTGHMEMNSTASLRRRLCRRVMPEFPSVIPEYPRHDGSTNGALWARLEQHQAETCPRLKPGNICPHRGIDLTPFIKPDGTAICPGHGLKWDTATGALLRHHRAEAC